MLCSLPLVAMVVTAAFLLSRGRSLLHDGALVVLVVGGVVAATTGWAAARWKVPRRNRIVLFVSSAAVSAATCIAAWSPRPVWRWWMPFATVAIAVIVAAVARPHDGRPVSPDEPLWLPRPGGLGYSLSFAHSQARVITLVLVLFLFTPLAVFLWLSFTR